MQDEATADASHSSNDRNNNKEEEKERIWLCFKKDAEYSYFDHLVHRCDALALISLMDLLRETKNQSLNQSLCLNCKVTKRGRRLEEVAVSTVGKYDDRRSIGYHEFREKNFAYGKVDVSDTPLRDSVPFSHLEFLEFDIPFKPFESISSWMADKIFPGLIQINLNSSHGLFASPMSSEPFLSWMTDTNLPSLECVDIYNLRSDECVDNSLDLLTRLDINLTKKLKYLDLHHYYCNMQATHLETLLIEVLPRMPNLSHLKRRPMHIQNLPDVLDKIIRRRKAETPPKTTTAKPLSLDVFSIDLSTDPATRATLLRFLECFNHVICFDLDHDIVQTYGDEIAYALIMNSVGRRLLEDGSRGISVSEIASLKRKREISDQNTATPSLPASVWPIVLKRAQNIEFHGFPAWANATGIYYLLRNGPVLFERHKLKGLGRKALIPAKTEISRNKIDSNTDK